MKFVQKAGEGDFLRAARGTLLEGLVRSPSADRSPDHLHDRHRDCDHSGDTPAGAFRLRLPTCQQLSGAMTISDSHSMLTGWTDATVRTDAARLSGQRRP